MVTLVIAAQLSTENLRILSAAIALVHPVNVESCDLFDDAIVTGALAVILFVEVGANPV
jgi:hypothetical protein